MIIFPFKTLNRSKQRKIDMAIKIVIKRQFKENVAQKAFEQTARYDRAIADYLNARTSQQVKGCYTS